MASRIYRITTRRIAKLLRQCLDEGAMLEIEGLGVFRGNAAGEFEFVSCMQPKVFLAYVEEDLEHALKLYTALQHHGCDPWLDKQKLLPGQNWPRRIESAISVSDYFVALLSKRSVGKRGQFQAELRYALDCAARLPLDQPFFLPLRLDECRVPAKIANSFQYVDLFNDWEGGVEKLLQTIRQPEPELTSS